VSGRLRALSALLAALATLGLVAACGGGGGTPQTHASAPPPRSTTANIPVAVRLREGIAACRKKVLHDPYIPVADRATAAADCEGFKTGQVGPLYAIVESACERQVQATVPANRQTAALKACKTVFASAAG
jgi:hypothetical protein